MQYLPIFMDVNNKNVLVVGGGEVASRKVDLLLSASAKVTVLSPRLNTTLQRYRDDGKITAIIDGYSSHYLGDYVMVWVTTDDTLLNKQVWQDCCTRNILVNVADHPELCEFITPSIIDRSPLQIAISSGGASPVLIRYLREKLEALLPETLGLLGSFAGQQRGRVQQQFDNVTARRRFWERFFTSTAVTSATNIEQLQIEFDRELNRTNTDLGGAIYIIQLPAEVDLLRLRALRLMQQSDVILYASDGSSSSSSSNSSNSSSGNHDANRHIDAYIELCRRDAERQPILSQYFVDQALLRKQQGERVCLLVNNNEQFALLTTKLDAVSVVA